MAPLFRPIAASDQPHALHLWDTVFGREPGYFERYYQVDPWYVEGDSLGAWMDGTLVSAVHVCRRHLAWEDSNLLCGGIANVATLPAYRRRGLSRRLLALAIDRMTEIGCDFSMLGTGVPSHYAALGWESIDLPRFCWTGSKESFAVECVPDAAAWTEEIALRYSHVPRILQQSRPREYFEGWVEWGWKAQEAAFYRNEGYIVVSPPYREERLPMVIEWRAADREAEMRLFREAFAREERLVFCALPQHIDWASLEAIGVIERAHSEGQMIRRIGLDMDEYVRVKEAYLSGLANEWPADGF